MVGGWLEVSVMPDQMGDARALCNGRRRTPPYASDLAARQ